MFEKSQEDNKQCEKTSRDRRHLLQRGGLFAGFATVASVFSLTPFSPVQAATLPQSRIPTFVPLPAYRAEPYISVVVQSSTYQDFKNQVRSTYVGIFAIQEQNAVAYQVKTAQTTSIQVIIPITGGAGAEYQSFYTATFRSGSYAISSEYSGLVTQKTPQIVHIDIKEYRGALVVDADLRTTDGFLQGNVQTSKKSVPLQNTLQNGQSLSSVVPLDFGSWFHCMEDCVGVTWIVELILKVCGVVCEQGETLPLCFPCVDLLEPVITVAFFASTIYCLGYCS